MGNSASSREESKPVEPEPCGLATTAPPPGDDAIVVTYNATASASSDGAEWSELGQFFESGGQDLIIEANRWVARGMNMCATVHCEPLQLSEHAIYTYEFKFDSEHFMIGAFDAAHFSDGIPNADYHAAAGKNSWCLENVRLQRSLFLNGKVHALSDESEEKLTPDRPIGVELNDRRCVAEFNLAERVLTVRLSEEDPNFSETDEPWVVPFGHYKTKAIWPYVCVFGHGHCTSFPARRTSGGAMIKSAAKNS